MNIFESLDFQSLLLSIEKHFVISFAIWVIVFIAILLDLWDALYTANKLKEKIKSHRIRITIQKTCEYWRGLVIGLLIDTIGILFPFYTLPYITLTIGVGLLCIEAKSMYEHAKRRKSRTVELTKIINIIVDAADKKDAKKAVNLLTEYMNSEVKSDKRPFPTKEDCED